MSKIIGLVMQANTGKWPRIDGDGNPIELTKADLDAFPIYAGMVPEVIDDQAMVRVPAFHFRYGTVPNGPHAGEMALWISDEAADGFALHPAFRKHGNDIAQFHVGAYQGTPDGGPEKMGSQAGMKPLTSIDFPAMQRAAAARGDGWMLWGFHQLAALKLLALIDCGTPDIKSVLGNGYVNGDGVRETDYSAQVVWRGIVGLWGNVWQMVDGLQTNGNSEYCIWDASGNQEYVETGVQVPRDGWQHGFSTQRGKGFDLAGLFLPISTRNERSKSTYGNYFWGDRNCVAYHGGGWGSGESAGLVCLTVYYAASYSYTGIGGRLAKV